MTYLTCIDFYASFASFDSLDLVDSFDHHVLLKFITNIIAVLHFRKGNFFYFFF